MDLAKHTKDFFGYDVDFYGRSVGILFCFGFAVRVIACIVMIVSDRDKKV